MAWRFSLDIDGYTVGFEQDMERHLLVPVDAPLDDPGYVRALQRAAQLFPHVAVYMAIDEHRYYWYKGGYGRAHVYKQRDDVIKLILQFLQQEELTHPAWLEQFLDDLNQNLPVEEVASKPERKAKPGYVYLVQEINGPHFKIGHSKNPAHRQKTFNVKLPYQVEFVCLIQTNDMEKLEHQLHERFSEKRVDGEWFLLSPEDVEYIKGLAT